MTIHRLSAGCGYRYLTRTTARGDADHAPSSPLTTYYTATGTPPGRWQGSGLAGLGDGAGVPAGGIVDEAAMAALFGTGHDPITGAPLGRAYPTFTSTSDRIAARVGRLPGSLTKEQWEPLGEQIAAEENARPVRQAVAGFDLTFTVPKSVSVLWALAEPPVQAEIVAAHHAAVADTVGVLESQALFTRVGAGSCAQVTTRGAVAAGFDHADTRTGDPNLHTHLVLANKVQGPDGGWRSVDSRALFTAAVALSETYDSLLADHLTNRLGVTWAWRDRGPNRSPAHELTAVSDHLLTVFSTRSTAITTAVTRMIRDHIAANGTRPSRRQVLRMRQQATLDTRPDKATHTLADQMRTWRDLASAALDGRTPADVVRAALAPATPPRNGLASDPSMAQVCAGLGDAAVSGLAGDVLAALIERRSTWTRWNTLAETARATRHLRFATTAERLDLHDRVVTAALAVCNQIDPADAFAVPTAYQRPDGASVFSRAGTTRFTHPLVLAAEERLVAAHADTNAPTAPGLETVPTGEALPSCDAGPGTDAGACLSPSAAGEWLAADQARAVQVVCTSGRRVEVLVGPAGSGKTTTLRVLRQIWEGSRGFGSVIGLAPSATAARNLAGSLGIACENTAKWLHESRPQLEGPPRPIWRMRPGQLVIVDEASLASTASLDALRQQAADADAKLLLVGDHHQLGPVDAGGVFALLAETGDPIELDSLWRFHQAWEADATRGLRDGDPEVLKTYQRHSRLHDGSYEHMLDSAYEGWRTDLRAGASSVLLAHDRRTVDALNHRARADRVDDGAVAAEGVTTRDGTTIGVGDTVITRRNDRRLALPHGSDYVRNGMLWDVAALHSDGSATLLARGAEEPQGNRERARSARLPADYVARHLDLGYAVTIHRAQGLTVDTAHVLAGAGMTREHLYVALTRGRRANYAYTPTDHPDDASPDGMRTGTDILRDILDTPGTEPSATAASHAAVRDLNSAERLQPIAATLAADITRRRWSRLLAGQGGHLLEKLTRNPEVGTLYAALARAETAGHCADAILSELSRAAERQGPASDDAERASAAIRQLRETVDAWNDTTRAHTAIDPHDPLRTYIAADPDDPAAPALDYIQHLVDQRIQRALDLRERPQADDIGPVDQPRVSSDAPAVIYALGGPAP